jgi:hypothetical protein
VNNGSPVTSQRADIAQDVLVRSVDEVHENGLPHLALLLGETGRGKSYAIQSLYDRLCLGYPGYWKPGLTPKWPADSLAALRRQRKTVNPPDELRRAGETPGFLWLGVGCSGYADAPRLDPTADLLRQLQRLISESVAEHLATAKKQKWVAERVAETIGQLAPVIGALKSILETLGGLPGLIADDIDSYRLTERKRAFEALRCYAKILEGLEVSPPPLVVVIDDATGATADLLEAASSLVFEPTEEHRAGDAGNRYLPEVLDQVPPVPVLFVFSAWDHALFSGVDPTPISQWLAEYETLGLHAEMVNCREIDPSEAERMLERWPFGPTEEIRQSIVWHVASNNANERVNPLVLAEHVAAVEEQRSVPSEEIDVAEDYIKGLSTSPEHHIQERLEQLQNADGGREALALLGMLCAISIRLPWGMVETLREACGLRTQIDRIRQLFADLGVATELAEDEVDPLTLFTIDADLFDYLKRNARLSTDELEVLASAAGQFFRAWISYLEADSMLRGFRDPWGPARAASVTAVARLGFVELEAADDTVTALASVLVGDDVDVGKRQEGPASAFALAWLVGGCPREAATREILEGCIELGVSATGFACLKAIMELRDISNEEELLLPLLERLEQRADLHNGQIVLIEGLCALRKFDHALVLASAPQLGPQGVMILAKKLERAGRRDDALELLASCPDGSQQVVLRRARLTADGGDDAGALAILEPYSDQWGVARQMCDILDRLHREDERAQILAQWFPRNPQAACILGSDLAERDEVEAARAVLRAWSRSSLPAARQLALLEWEHGHFYSALASIAPFLHDEGVLQTKSAIAQMLDQVGRNGLRFRMDKAGKLVVEEAKPPQDTVPPAQPSSGETSAPLVAEEVINEIRTRLDEEVSSGEIARELHERYGDPDTQQLSMILRDQVRADRDQGMAAVTCQFLMLLPRRTATLACTIADMAFIAHLAEAKEMARSALAPYAGSRRAAVKGRLVALEILFGRQPRISTIKKLERKERSFAFVAVFRMLAGNPLLEAGVWRALGEAGEQYEDAEVRRLSCIYATGRMLTMIRQCESSAPDRREFLDELLPTIPPTVVVPTLEGVLHAFAENPESVVPRLFPYQIVSMYESLSLIGRANADLERGLEAALVADLKDTPDHIEAFLGWVEFSGLARRVGSALQAE